MKSNHNEQSIRVNLNPAIPFKYAAGHARWRWWWTRRNNTSPFIVHPISVGWGGEGRGGRERKREREKERERGREGEEKRLLFVL